MKAKLNKIISYLYSFSAEEMQANNLGILDLEDVVLKRATKIAERLMFDAEYLQKVEDTLFVNYGEFALRIDTGKVSFAFFIQSKPVPFGFIPSNDSGLDLPNGMILSDIGVFWIGENDNYFGFLF